jgi:hypothetical protein
MSRLFQIVSAIFALSATFAQVQPVVSISYDTDLNGRSAAGVVTYAAPRVIRAGLTWRR